MGEVSVAETTPRRRTLQTRLARRATISFVVIAVITQAASASADCAWVLWDDVGAPGGTITFRRVAAYESRVECFRGADARIRQLLGEKVKVSKLSDSTLGADSEDGKLTMFVQCWPDTVDPRGAKGK
jgi:hypothetical protein